MNEKVVLITGASSGIGYAMSRYFYSKGAKVVMVARNHEKLTKMAEEMGDRAYVYSTDLSIMENIKSIFDFCKEKTLKLDGIVHCAGLTANIPLRVNDIDIMDQIMKVNVEAFAQMCKYVSSSKYSNDGASMVAISSSASLVGDKGIAIYSASKAALNVLVKSAAMELTSRKIRVNAIAPAMVNTEMYQNTLLETPHMKDIVESNQPFGVIEPEHIAYLAEYLISDKSKYITGETIVVGAGHVF